MSEHGHIKFWQEIGRRNVLRVAAVYVGFSWAVVHSGVVVGEALELPHWIMRFVSAVLIVGFPAVVAFAWVYEITPEGLKRTVEVEKSASLTHRTAQRLDIIIIALIVLLAGLYGAERYLLPHEGAEIHAAAEGAKAPAAGEGISIAVLPFLNLSGDASQEFFSDGMTEEITSALAKVKGLRVVGRTSAFEFKGQNKDLHAIGQALRATNLLEGSVRKEGNQIRVTAQLIRADDGTHIWTENYDRELKSVFAIQDDISQAIARALQVPLGLAPGESLVTDRAEDVNSYQQYLRAKAMVRDTNQTINAIPLLKEVVARDPGYAPAWGLLAQAYQFSAQGLVRASTSTEQIRAVVSEYYPNAEAAARRAIQLDPRLVDGHLGLAEVLSVLGKPLLAEESFLKALALDPSNADALVVYGSILANTGKLSDGLAMSERGLALEPFAPRFKGYVANMLWVTGRTDDAIALQGPGVPAEYYASVGRYNEAAERISKPPPGYSLELAQQGAALIRTAPAVAASPKTLPYLGSFSWIYLYVGAPDRAIEDRERGAAAGYTGAFRTLWHRSYAPVRKTERFKDYVRKAGLVEYWRARGWPDMCHPVGADDFECS